MTALAARAAHALNLLGQEHVQDRPPAHTARTAEPVAVLARAPLGPGLGVSLLEAGGRRLLVGWGKEGVRLVRDLGPGEARP